MSITDELRHNIEGAEQLYGCECKHLLAIADRIDATHEEAMQREHEVGYAEGCGAGLATVALGAPEWIAQHEGEMAKQGWIRLPKDADNVPWNVGDRDEDGNVVIELRLTSDGWFVITDGEWPYRPESKRHHHAPTVEGVLREFANECLTYATCVDDHEVVDAIKLYAAKLRLAEGEDA